MSLRRALSVTAALAAAAYLAFLTALFLLQGSYIYSGAKNRVDPHGTGWRDQARASRARSCSFTPGHSAARMEKRAESRAVRSVPKR